MLTELEDSKPITGKSPNYYKFTVTPIIEDNLLMIIKDASGYSAPNCLIHPQEVVEIIFEVSLN